MSKTSAPARGPKSRRLAEERFYALLSQSAMENEKAFLEAMRHEVPEAWHTLEMDLEVEAPKEKVTLYLDRAVVTMFRKMGKGYHARINRILETWLQMKISEVEAFRAEMIARVKAAREDKGRSEAEKVLDREAEALVEHWAYREGFEAGRRG